MLMSLRLIISCSKYAFEEILQPRYVVSAGIHTCSTLCKAVNEANLKRASRFLMVMSLYKNLAGSILTNFNRHQ